MHKSIHKTIQKTIQINKLFAYGIMKHLSDIERLKIIILYNDNKWSSTKISNYMNINRNTVLLWVNQHNDTKNINEKQKTGRNKKQLQVKIYKFLKLLKIKTKNSLLTK